jgi:hypothetical protein
MTDLIQLSDAEIAAVSGGGINIHASQSNSSYVSQSAYAYNSGAVSATAASVFGDATAAAAGAEANNTAVVYQTNAILASIG